MPNKEEPDVRLNKHDAMMGKYLARSLREGGVQGECLSLEDIASLAGGTMAAEDREKAMKHLVSCQDCYEVYSGTVQSIEEEEKRTAASEAKVRQKTGHWFRMPSSSVAAAALVMALGAAGLFTYMNQHTNRRPAYETPQLAGKEEKREAVPPERTKDDTIRTEPGGTAVSKPPTKGGTERIIEEKLARVESRDITAAESKASETVKTIKQQNAKDSDFQPARRAEPEQEQKETAEHAPKYARSLSPDVKEAMPEPSSKSLVKPEPIAKSGVRLYMSPREIVARLSARRDITAIASYIIPPRAAGDSAGEQIQRYKEGSASTGMKDSREPSYILPPSKAAGEEARPERKATQAKAKEYVVKALWSVAFEAGMLQTELEIAIAAQDNRLIQALAERIEVLLQAISAPPYIVEYYHFVASMAKEKVLPKIGGGPSTLVSYIGIRGGHPYFFQLGAWAGGARLAVAAGDTGYFAIKDIEALQEAFRPFSGVEKTKEALLNIEAILRHGIRRDEDLKRLGVIIEELIRSFCG